MYITVNLCNNCSYVHFSDTLKLLHPQLPYIYMYKQTTTQLEIKHKHYTNICKILLVPFIHVIQSTKMINFTNYFSFTHNLVLFCRYALFVLND